MYVIVNRKAASPQKYSPLRIHTHAWEIQKLEEEEQRTQKSMTQVVLFLEVIAFHRG